jgi:[glutamine synthetase] adenylyltransferase / [glutamine synthetase]-adenylyl-L-tyrosine phosphorylase
VWPWERRKSTITQTALARCIATVPLTSTLPAARDAVTRWTESISATPAGISLAHLTADFPVVGRLIESIAGGSPYLWDLVRTDPARLVALLEADPEERLAALLLRMRQEVAACTDETAVMRLLRQHKAEAALLIAIADIGGVWEVMRVTRALTEVADAAVATSVRFLLSAAVRAGTLTPVDPVQPEQGSGYVVIAMGKMGGGELNYSSDIDVIVFYDSATAALAPVVEPTGFFVRLTRSLVKLLQERTADGYVFRVDLRLRPDPASTHIAISVPSALDYYERSGQNWERAALIKARPCAGDLSLGAQMLHELSSFIWRRYLDFAAVAEVHAMKRQIHAFRGHGEIAVEGHNVKLGRGGIREIEFFVQTQQLIAGGRNPQLRGRETLSTLAELAEGGWISVEAREELDTAYRFLRKVEHRLQMMDDEQTHSLPADEERLAHFARFLGYEGRTDFAKALLSHLHAVQRQYAKLFEGAVSLPGIQQPLVFPSNADDRATIAQLAGLGFKKPLEVSATVRRWLSGTYRSLRSEFARNHLVELVPFILVEIARAENPEAALVALDRFLSVLHRGPRFYSLLRQNPDLVSFLATVLGTAPRLADVLAQHPEVIDPLLDPAFFGPLPDETKLGKNLQLSLGQSRSFEDVLDRARLFRQEQMFLIGARVLSGTVAAEQAGEAFAQLADVLIRTMHASVEAEFAAVHGHVQGQEAAIVALGKLGGREMTANSDLDLIVVYDFDSQRPESDGERPLYGGQYFARLTQRLINALTAPTNYGRLYDVDMRLRPSGRSGPIATSFEAFDHYHEKEAWTWEHMALTRARIVSASPDFADRVTRVIQRTLQRQRDLGGVAADVLEMRRAIASEKGDSDRWNIKYVAGGLVDVEFVAQYLQLVYASRVPDILDTSTARVLEKAAKLGVLAAEHAEVLRPAVRLYQDLTQILRLCLAGPFDPASAGPALLALLARAADLPDFATLEAHLTESQRRVREVFDRILMVRR